MSNWIKCSERLPELCGHNVYSKSVQVYKSSNKCQHTAIYDTENKRWFCFFSNLAINDVTHWAELISSPEAE